MKAKVSRVILASRPKIQSDMISHLLECQPDINVVHKVLDPLKLFLAIKITGAAVVIVTPLAGNGEPHHCAQMRAVYPQLAIVTQPARGKTA